MKKQKGVSAVSVLSLLVLVVFVGYFAYCAIPAYVDNIAVDRIIDEVQADEKSLALSDEELQAVYVKRLRHNNVWDVSPASSFQYERISTGVFTGYNYEVRRRFLFNIDLVLHFQRSPIRG